MKGNIRIAVAILLGVIVVLGAFYLRQNLTFATVSHPVAVTRAPTAEQYISPADANNNSVSDWKEELRQKSLRETAGLDTYRPPATNTPVDNSLTGKFARAFFEQYMSDKANGNFSDANKSQFISNSVASVVSAASDRPLTAADTVPGDPSPEALHEYGNKIAEITYTYSRASGNEDELTIVKDALDTNDASRLAVLDPIIASYQDFLSETKKVPTPPQLLQQQIDLLNAYQAMLGDLSAMRQAFTDPLRSLVRIKQYQKDEIAFHNAFTAVYQTLYNAGVRYTADEAAARLGLLPK